MGFLPTILSVAVGIIVGFIYVFQEYRGKFSNEISKSPRLKNLGVVIGPGVLGAVIDWKALAGGQNIEVTKQGVVLWYSVSVAVTIAVLLVLGIATVGLEARRRNLQVASRARISPLSAIGLFVTRGLTAYEERVAQINRDAAKEIPANPIPIYAEGMRIALLAEQGFRATQQNRELAISDVLRVMVDVTRSQLPNAQTAVTGAHWLKAIAADKFKDRDKARFKFGFQHLGDCSDVLLVQQYGRGYAGEKYALPVSKDRLRCIGGAPLAFRKEGVEAVITEKMKFSGVEPKNTQFEMKGYFCDGARRSQLCIPIQKGTSITGVVVIEANTDLFDPRDPKVLEVGQALHPFCLNLASLLPGDEP